MKVIICLDDKNGMMFNQRRQSRDKVVVQDIIEMTAGSSLHMNAYSSKLFGESEHIAVSEEFLQECKKGEYCFVENRCLSDVVSEIEEIIVYRWGRVYPADFKLDIPLTGGRFILKSENEMVGFSHPEMLKQVYCAKN